LGPTAAPIEKINDFYRSHIIIKTNKPLLFQDFYMKNLELNQKLSNVKGIKFRIDVDPLSLL
jgi:primosomal protein N'